ncbi:MAG: putative ABC transport system permease protein [Roseivirga sp.]|jgi:putative ABC transport system permease protein
MTFDLFHEKGEDIYRVRSSMSFDRERIVEFVSMPVGPTVKEEIPAVVNQSRYVKTAFDVRLGDVTQNQGKVFYVEPEFLEMFNFPSKYGDGLSVLRSSSEIAIVEKAAKRIFGKKMAIGESLDLNIKGEWKTYTVGAILRDVPSNSSIDFEMLVPFQTYLTANNRKSNNAKDWFTLEFTFQTFIQTLPEINTDTLTLRMDELAIRKTVETPQYAPQFSLQPLHDIHFEKSFASSAQAGMRQTGDKFYSFLLSGIALLVLILACVNFTNLSLARALPRAKEIGIRKVIGARRKQLIAQFLGEAFLISTTAFLLGLLLAELVLPYFELAAQKEFSVSIIDNPTYVFIAFVAVTLSAFLAGSYPAFVIARLNTVSALKGSFDGVSGKGGLQKILIILQFSVAAVLIIGVLAMNRQINYLVNLDRGYDDSNLISVYTGDLSKASLLDSTKSKGQALLNLVRAELEKTPSIINVSGSATGYTSLTVEEPDPLTGELTKVQGHRASVDFNYFKTMGIKLLEGRDFSEESAFTGQNHVLVNERFASVKNFKDSTNGGINSKYGKAVVIGIVQDFNLFSVTQEISPMVFGIYKSRDIGKLLIKFRPGTLSNSLAAVEAAWLKFNPNNPFEFTLIEESNASQLAKEKRWRSIILTASLIAISISCLGLFGLAYISTQRRIKEVGIRKVFGAPVPTIVYILARGFSVLVILSLVVAAPFAFYAGEEWLSTFPYRINMTWDLFLIAAGVQLAIALLTVSYHAVKAAISNPIKALRFE